MISCFIAAVRSLWYRRVVVCDMIHCNCCGNRYGTIPHHTVHLAALVCDLCAGDQPPTAVELVTFICLPCHGRSASIVLDGSVPSILFREEGGDGGMRCAVTVPRVR